MKLKNPNTKEVIEVPDTHGEMLLRKGFYRLVVEEEKKPRTRRKGK